MDDFDSEINDLIQQFFEHINEGVNHYFSADDLVILIEYFIDNNLMEYAQKALELALSLYPDDEIVIDKQAEMLLLDKKPRKALDVLQAVSNPQDASTFGMIGECSLRLKRIKSAIDNFDRHLELCDPDELMAAYASVANIFNEYSRFDLALEYANRGLEVFPTDNFEILIEKAYSLASLECFNEAIELYNMILDNDPYDIDAWSNLASVYDRIGNQTDTLKCFEYMSAIQPDDETERQKALCHIRLKDFESAARILVSLNEKDPKNYPTKLLLAQTYYLDDQLDKALPIYSEIVKSYPMFPEAFTGYANCIYILQDDYKEAVRILKKADKLFPDNTGVMFDLAKLEIDMERNNGNRHTYISGMKHLLRCLQQEPDNPEYNNVTAFGYIQNNNFEEALQHFTIALNNSDSPHQLPNIYLNLTFSAWCADDMELFRKYYTEAKSHYANTDEILFNILPDTKDYIKKHNL